MHTFGERENRNEAIIQSRGRTHLEIGEFISGKEINTGCSGVYFPRPRGCIGILLLGLVTNFYVKSHMSLVSISFAAHFLLCSDTLNTLARLVPIFPHTFPNAAVSYRSLRCRGFRTIDALVCSQILAGTNHISNQMTVLAYLYRLPQSTADVKCSNTCNKLLQLYLVWPARVALCQP